MQKFDNQLFQMIKTMQENSSYIEVIIFVKDFDTAVKFFEGKNYQIKARFPFINAICVGIDFSDIKYLSRLNNVAYISSQAKVFTQSVVAKSIINIKNFFQPNNVGKGINVAVIDTGIRTHIDFLYPHNRIIKFVDIIDNSNDDKPFDDNGHGTFVAGLIAGNGTASGHKYSGFAPQCNLIILKALDEKGQSNSVEMLQAMQWIFDNKEKYNIKVVCMSFGAMPTSKNDPLMKEAERLWDSGIVVVAAGGNSGPEKNTIKSPGTSRKIITVGSFDDARDEQENYNVEKFKIADFSSRGPAFEFYKPDLVVSGVDIISCGLSSDYTTMSGTSVSAPMIAGISALLIEKYKHNITPNQIKSILQHHCLPIVKDRNMEGFGYLHF